MDLTPSFIEYIEKAVVENWDRDALTDYKGTTLQYHDVARKIEKLHILFANSGIEKGDKIALCGRNSSNWAVAFLATLAYGAVAVPIQNEFTPDQIYNIVNHSEARLLFVGDVVATQIDASQMPALEGVFYLPDFSLTLSRSEQLTYAREHLNEMFGSKFPKFFRREHVAYHHGDAEDVALINYTSGTTGFSKGGATREDVKLMRANCPASVKVKAAGGISSLKDAEDFIELGAERLGTSRIVKLAMELENEVGAPNENY